MFSYYKHCISAPLHVFVFVYWSMHLTTSMSKCKFGNANLYGKKNPIGSSREIRPPNSSTFHLCVHKRHTHHILSSEKPHILIQWLHAASMSITFPVCVFAFPGASSTGSSSAHELTLFPYFDALLCRLPLTLRCQREIHHAAWRKKT